MAGRDDSSGRPVRLLARTAWCGAWRVCERPPGRGRAQARAGQRDGGRRAGLLQGRAVGAVLLRGEAQAQGQQLGVGRVVGEALRGRGQGMLPLLRWDRVGGGSGVMPVAVCHRLAWCRRRRATGWRDATGVVPPAL